MKKEEKDKKDKPAIETKWSVFIMVVNMFIGLLNIGSAVYSFKEKFYILGILYIILVIFCFIPRKIVKISHGKRLLIIIILSIVLMLLMGIFGWTIPETYIYHNMNEDFIFDMKNANASLNIYNITESTSFEGRTTNGYFLTLNCRFTNMANYSIILSNWTGYIKDNQNNTFDGEFSDGEKRFEANEKRDVYFIFEVPKTSQELKLYLKDYRNDHIVNLNR